jgi:hypothetical protein
MMVRSQTLQADREADITATDNVLDLAAEQLVHDVQETA